MKCVREDLKAHITDVLVGEAEPSVRAEVLAHIETCESCQDERDQMTAVLGLLKEAPPWVDASTSLSTSRSGAAATSADADADALSVIQRQKIESLAARRSTAEASPSAKKKKNAGGLPSSWLAMAAGLAAVGIALVLVQRNHETKMGVESPAPVASASLGPNQLPQAPEAPEVTALQDVAAAERRRLSEPLTAPAARRSATPLGVDVSPEAMREFKRQQEAEQGTGLAQAPEKNEFQLAKKDEGGAAAGGSFRPQAAPVPQQLPPPPSGQTQQDRRAIPVPEEAQVRSAESIDVTADAPVIETRNSSVARSSAGAPRSKQKEMSRDEVDQLRGLGYANPAPREDRPTPPPPVQQPREMYFEAKGTNPFIETEEDAQATFGLDVDTASYTLTRNYLNRGTLPPPAAVRVEEFVNSFPNNVAAERGRDGESAFAVRVDGAPNPLHPGYHIIRVAMKAKEVDPRERKAAHLTFVIDVSGSMAAENRLGLVKRSLAMLVDKLDERDTIGIVVYGTNGRRVLAPTPASNRDRILSVIERLRPEGSTNLQDGLDLGYEMAMESFQRGASNRVVLCTDGVANTGQTEADSLLSRIRNEAKRGVDMMALGFGMGNYNDALLQRLADEGNGQYAYIDDLGEARAFFLRRLTSVLEVVARDAKAQVEFNPARVERYRLLGYEKRDVADRDFRNDSVDAGEINSGHSVTALFEVKLRGGSGSGRIGTARIRYKTGPRSEGVEFTRQIEDEAMARTFDQASPAFRTAFVASRFAEHLRKSYWVKDESLTAVLNLADGLPEATQTNELTDLIRKATRLIKPQTREDW